MKLIVERFKEIYDGTMGRFRLVSQDRRVLLEGFTLEPAGPDTVERGRDKRIPAGVYQTTWHESDKFQRLCHCFLTKRCRKIDAYSSIAATSQRYAGVHLAWKQGGRIRS